MNSIVFLDYNETIGLVCEFCEISKKQLQTETRKAEVVMARFLITYMLLYIGYSMRRIGVILEKDRSTIHYYKRRLSSGMDFKIARELTRLRIFLLDKNLLLPNLMQFNIMMDKYGYK